MSGLDNTLYSMILGILCTFLIFLIIVGILEKVFEDKISVEKRIKKIFYKNKSIKISEIKPKKKEFKFSNKIKISAKLENELQTAGILMRVEEFAILWIVLCFVPSGMAAILTGNMITSLTLVFLGMILLPIYVSSKKKKRVAAFENQLSDALVIMSNCLHSGLTFQQAMENIGKEMSEPISKEFSRVCTEIKYGSTSEKALNAMVDRIGSRDLMLMASAINIQKQVGGNLSEILDNISETIKARMELKGEIKVLTATGRTSGMVIGMLPVGIGLLLLVINPSYMSVFFTTQSGKMMLMIAALMEFVGFIFIKKIVTIKY